MRSLLILSTAALAFALAQTTLIPALGELADELHTDASGVAWTLTGYLLSAAVCTPIFGRLGDMFGKRRLLVISLERVRRRLGRVRAGRRRSRCSSPAASCRAPAAASSRSASRSSATSSRARRSSSSIGLISATFGIGGGAGLILGGVLVDQASYHWIFWLGAGDGRRRRRAHAAADPRVAEPLARAGSTSAAPPCSRSASRSRCWRSPAPTTGAGAARGRSR